jgi:hypothetical protein
MNTPYNQYNEVLNYFVIEGYQEGCISITNNEPTDADLNWLAFSPAQKTRGSFMRSCALLLTRK